MRLAEVINAAEFHIEHEHAAKENVFLLQQALADGWECEFERPKPVDEDTGEVFPWIVIATDDDTGNKIRFRVSKNFISVKLGRSVIPLESRDDDALKAEFEREYDDALEAVVDVQLSSVSDQLDDNLSVMNGTLEPDMTFQERHAELLASVEHDIYRPFIEKWHQDYAKLSDGLVNSAKLAAKLDESFNNEFTMLFHSAMCKVVDATDGREA